MRHKSHTVWTWLDADDVIRYVGYGQYDEQHPAITRFDQRFDSDSQLDTWLLSLEEEPKREGYGEAVVSYGEAIGFVMGLRQRHAKTLLSDRGPSTYAGGGPPKGVYKFSESDITRCAAYESVRHAARELGVNPSTVSRWCNDPDNKVWGFTEECCVEPPE